MTITLNFHATDRITAQACHHDGVDWLEIVLRQPEGNFPLTVFLDDPQQVDAYAAAINGVNTVRPPNESEAA